MVVEEIHRTSDLCATFLKVAYLAIMLLAEGEIGGGGDHGVLWSLILIHVDVLGECTDGFLEFCLTERRLGKELNWLRWFDIATD